MILGFMLDADVVIEIPDVLITTLFFVEGLVVSSIAVNDACTKHKISAEVTSIILLPITLLL